MLASCIHRWQPPPTSLCFCGGCSPRYIGWLPLRRGFKTPCVGVGVALGWPLANQQPPVAGHPRPTWSTSPNIHIDLLVLADRRANPHPIPPLPSLSILHPVQHTVSFSPCGPSSLPPLHPRSTIPRERKRERDREREGRA